MTTDRDGAMALAWQIVDAADNRDSFPDERQEWSKDLELLARALLASEGKGKTRCVVDDGKLCPNTCAREGRCVWSPSPPAGDRLTLDELALAKSGAQLAIAWWRDRQSKTVFAKERISEYQTLIAKLAGILDFIPPAPPSPGGRDE